MSNQVDEKVEYGKNEIREKEATLNEVKANDGLTTDDLIDQKTKIKRTETFKKSETLREANS